MISIKESEDHLVFSVYVQPRSSKVAIVGCHENALKIKLTAPPVGGAANKQCIKLLAKSLGLAKSDIAITGGLSHRKKQIRIQPANKSLTSSDRTALKNKLAALAKKSS
ncbi:MAG: DUF167 domain-containing protein [Desulfobacteraceae bacterium]|jgi:uncharacterized protein